MLIYALIPLLPLLAALVLGLFGARLEAYGHKLVVPAVTAAFLLSVALFAEVAANGAVHIHLYRLLEVGRLQIDAGLYIDELTVLLLLLVTGVSAVVQVYAARYMIGDARHSRFFALTALFTGAMTVLVMSSNLLLTFMFWEVMGLCSYLLVSHYGERDNAARAATRVFLVNAVADVGLFCGVILAYMTFGTLSIPEILTQVQSGPGIPAQTATALTLCLFIGAMGKSAQVPAHAWLPLAMEAPTPVSALIHAATMVNAGPFLLVRLSPLIILSDVGMAIIAGVGATTALFGAVVSLTQTDIKRTLAYSTISQLGFMVFLCGVGAFAAAIFHLVAHGCFKAFLFLSTGNALAATHRRFDTPRPPQAAPGSLFLWALVLSLVPPLVVFSGAYRSLWLAQGFSSASVALWVVGLGTVFFTAVYLYRGFSTVFHHDVTGTVPGQRVRPSPASAGLVLGLAGVTAILIAALLVTWQWFASFLAPALATASLSSDAQQPAGMDAGPSSSMWLLWPLLTGLLGIAAAYTQARRAAPGSEPAWRKRLYVFFLNKGYFNELYDSLIVRPTLNSARWLWKAIDRDIVDRLVLSLGAGSVAGARRLGRIDMAVDRQLAGVGSGSVVLARWLGRTVDTGGISRTVDSVGRGADVSGHAAERMEPRTLQHHLLVVVLWLVAALIFFYLVAG
ncbi:NADH-quinone oxidoreductase subunit L [Pseudohaliea rubra]|uniref:NADH-ubiquinone oxidoreductase chain L n=1 Tax=Pseudohaliea rubra DSM 19751 TaxID=1265313 RepID=A0A095VPF3_9GAMM|nr:NADH-quinone oxidoreductase subunit L [Pseudohaliea rubra]KGE02988.1 NADH-ubiquinone oxidoreductase chain L [Pseudohaliea rubra DSM 19751]